MEPEISLPGSQQPSIGPYPEPKPEDFCDSSKKRHFYGEQFLDPRPTSNLKDHSLSAVCDCNSIHSIYGGVCCIRNLRARVVVARIYVK
jgi:hypothetical protein